MAFRLPFTLSSHIHPHPQMIDADVPLNEEGTAFAPFSVRMLLQARGAGWVEVMALQQGEERGHVVRRHRAV